MTVDCLPDAAGVFWWADSEQIYRRAGRLLKRGFKASQALRIAVDGHFHGPWFEDLTDELSDEEE